MAVLVTLGGGCLWYLTSMTRAAEERMALRNQASEERMMLHMKETAKASEERMMHRMKEIAEALGKSIAALRTDVAVINANMGGVDRQLLLINSRVASVESYSRPPRHDAAEGC